MERGTYVSASGGLAALRRLEIVNNNLANINTPGFKKQILIGEKESFDQTLASITARNDRFARGDQERSPGVVSTKTVTDFSPGAIKNTGNPLDAALRNPKDFFVVETPSGPMYTRAGDFTLNAGGELVTMDGARVLGDGGPITVNGPGASIAPNGAVMVNGNPVGALQTVHIENTEQLERMGNSRFKLAAGAPPPEVVTPDIASGSLEMANVSAVTGIIDLITTNRGFQMYTKTAESIDQMNQSAINQVGRRN